MSRQVDALSTQAARQSYPRTRPCVCSVAGLCASRGAACGAHAVAVVHGAAHGLAARAFPAQDTAHAHSTLGPAAGVSQGLLRTVFSMHARFV